MRRVFLSFVAEDLDLVRMFRGQACNKNSDLEFADYSVKEPFDSSNAVYIRSQIRPKISRAAVTICLIGESTHRSRWVEWELQVSREEGNRIFGVRLHSNPSDLPPKVLSAYNSAIYDWNIADIVRAIG